jgi:CHAT domain-containing protein/tetratricopeptide (TPR) repeat protein
MLKRTVCVSSLMVLWMSLFAMAQTVPQETAAHEATRLQQEAREHLAAGRYQDGIGLAQRAVTMREVALGPEHPDFAASLDTLGTLYVGAGNYDLAISVYQRALALREQVLGAEHQDLVISLVNVADAYFRTRSYSNAEHLYQRAKAISEKVPGAKDVTTCKVLLGLANLYMETAAYDLAEPLYERALALQVRVSGAESLGTARVLNDLGGMYRNMGAYAQAKNLYGRALDIYEKKAGPENPRTVMALANLAIIYSDTGDYVQSEKTFKRALVVQEKTLGKEHPNTGRMLSYLATLYSNMGAYSDAEALFRRVISIQSKAQGAARIDMAVSLSNLAEMYLGMGLYSKAEPVCREALMIAGDSLGEQHPFTAFVVGILGNVYRKMGEYQKAEPLLKRAAAITEAVEGPEHRRTADTLGFLADFYFDSGAHMKALPLYRRALAIYEKALGPEHPATARTLRSLAVVDWVRGRTRQALSQLQQAQRIQSKNSAHLLSAGSEARKRDYLQTLIDDTFNDVFFSMSVLGTEAVELGLTSVLQHKGRVLDAVSDDMARIRRSVTPADHALLERLADVAGQLSSLTYGQGDKLSPEQYRRHLVKLTTQQEQLESELASRSQFFSSEMTPVTITNVQRVIPVNAALVEWFRYAPFDPDPKNIKARRGAPRYVAYVLKRTGAPVVVDIGQAQAVEESVRHLRAALGNPARTDVKQHAAVLSDKLLGPLKAHLRGVEHILFSPDGELNLVPMAALLDESGAYMAEHYNVSYLTSGRDLLRVAGKSMTIAGAVVIADPDYGMVRASVPRTTGTLQPQRSLDLDRGGLKFRPIAGTAQEAQDLKILLKLDNTSVLLRQDASEARLKQLKGPRILHIASHGFFLSDQQFTDTMGSRRGLGSARLVANENPLLRSGLALAGANERSSGEEDGILTALEAMQLDLSGTELVVLSACDSGVGEVQNGEGVYGLRRALALAGAQTQVTSLWKVSDEATRKLMVEYYRRLLQGEGRSSALRQVQRALLKDPMFAHPYYWASFIPIGNWNSLPALSGG